MSEETLMKFVEILLTTVITVAVPVLTAYIAAYVRKKTAELERQVPKDVLMAINLVADMVVTAAEQSGLKDELLRTGRAKKDWAMEYGEEMLRNFFGASPDLHKLGDVFWESVLKGLDVAIEQRVGVMNHERLWKTGPTG